MTDKIVAQGISHWFPVEDEPQGLQALQDISFTAVPGEFVAIVGESGCGKTTLLRILAGLIQATEGQALLDGRPIVAPTDDMGFVFQRSVLLEWRTVLDNVLLPVELAHEAPAKYSQRAQELLEMVGVGSFAARYPRQLSGGMQQRVSLARALVRRASVLLMDEPFSALDAITREQMQVELQRIIMLHGATTVFITHDIGEAVWLADRVLLMSPRPGRIRAEFAVPLPRPRTLEHRFEDQYTALTREIRLAMLGEPQAAAAAEG